MMISLPGMEKKQERRQALEEERIKNSCHLVAEDSSYLRGGGKPRRIVRPAMTKISWVLEWQPVNEQFLITSPMVRFQEFKKKLALVFLKRRE
jgi:hypothetical protein